MRHLLTVTPVKIGYFVILKLENWKIASNIKLIETSTFVFETAN